MNESIIIGTSRKYRDEDPVAQKLREQRQYDIKQDQIRKTRSFFSRTASRNATTRSKARRIELERTVRTPYVTQKLQQQYFQQTFIPPSELEDPDPSSIFSVEFAQSELDNFNLRQVTHKQHIRHVFPDDFPDEVGPDSSDDPSMHDSIFVHPHQPGNRSMDSIEDEPIFKEE